MGSEHHAHELTISIGADGTLQHDWLNWNHGASAETRHIELRRVDDAGAQEL